MKPNIQDDNLRKVNSKIVKERKEAKLFDKISVPFCFENT